MAAASQTLRIVFPWLTKDLILKFFGFNAKFLGTVIYFVYMQHEIDISVYSVMAAIIMIYEFSFVRYFLLASIYLV